MTLPRESLGPLVRQTPFSLTSRRPPELVLAGGTPAALSARFHRTLIDTWVAAVQEASSRTGLLDVVLAGGVFQNATLLTLVGQRLAQQGFRVLSHSKVPANDGGLALGQAAIAAARTLHNEVKHPCV